MKAIVLRKPKDFKHKLHAVSPVVATLILIVVAIVGAIAVGLIVSNVANTTGKQANASGVASGASTTLTIGGSTTIFPVTSSSIASFEAEYPGIQVSVVQGGSGAGMEGVIIGALDMGEASSFPTFSSYSTSAASMNPPENLVGTNIGGSGVVVITNGPTADTGSTPGQGFLNDGASFCYGITSAALYQIYSTGTSSFYILAGACGASTPANWLTFPSAGMAPAASKITAGACPTVASTNAPTVGTAATVTTSTCVLGTTFGAGGPVYIGPYFAVSRSDVPSGTQETFGAWIGISSSNQDIAGMGTSSGETATGNPGVLAAVQSCSYTNAVGCVGFVDIGFAEGQTLLQAQKLSLPELQTSAATGNDASTTLLSIQDCNHNYFAPSTALGCYVAYNFAAGSSASTSKVDSFIKAALAGSGPEFPDNAAANNQLARTFWLVTLGTPTASEQDFINFLTSPAQSSLFTNQGYYSVYQYKTG